MAVTELQVIDFEIDQTGLCLWPFAGNLDLGCCPQLGDNVMMNQMNLEMGVKVEVEEEVVVEKKKQKDDDLMQLKCCEHCARLRKRKYCGLLSAKSCCRCVSLRRETLSLDYDCDVESECLIASAASAADRRCR